MGLWEFWKQRKQKTAQEAAEPEEEGLRFDSGHYRPVIRSSICTGEQVAGFKNLDTGRFTEIMLIRNNEDIEEFTKKYNVQREEIHREW